MRARSAPSRAVALADEHLALTALSIVIVSTCLWTKVHWILRVELQSILFGLFAVEIRNQARRASGGLKNESRSP